MRSRYTPGTGKRTRPGVRGGGSRAQAPPLGGLQDVDQGLLRGGVGAELHGVVPRRPSLGPEEAHVGPGHPQEQKEEEDEAHRPPPSPRGPGLHHGKGRVLGLLNADDPGAARRGLLPRRPGRSGRGGLRRLHLHGKPPGLGLLLLGRLGSGGLLRWRRPEGLQPHLPPGEAREDVPQGELLPPGPGEEAGELQEGGSGLPRKGLRAPAPRARRSAPSPGRARPGGRSGCPGPQARRGAWRSPAPSGRGGRGPPRPRTGSRERPPGAIPGRGRPRGGPGP